MDFAFTSPHLSTVLKIVITPADLGHLGKSSGGSDFSNIFWCYSGEIACLRTEMKRTCNFINIKLSFFHFYLTR